MIGHAQITIDGENLRHVTVILGKPFVDQDIALHKIKSLDTCEGQASQMAGRDMQDWIVALWYGVEPKTASSPFRPGQQVCIIGPSQPRAKAEKLANEVLALLRDAGLEFAVCKDEAQASPEFTGLHRISRLRQ
jgi:hypothetical protein